MMRWRPLILAAGLGLSSCDSPSTSAPPPPPDLRSAASASRAALVLEDRCEIEVRMSGPGADCREFIRYALEAQRGFLAYLGWQAEQSAAGIEVAGHFPEAERQANAIRAESAQYLPLAEAVSRMASGR